MRTILIILQSLVSAGDDFPVTEKLQPAFVVTEHNSVASQEPERSERVLFFTASWCNPCKNAKAEFVPWLVKSGWVVSDSPSAHVQVVDADDNPHLIAEYKITALPTFVFIKNRKELRRAGYSDRATVVNLWFGKQQTAATQQPVNVASAGDSSAPTPYTEIVRVMAMLPKPETAFVEFGCGADAPWCVDAAKRWGCKCIGVEIDQERAASAREHVAALKLDHLITIIEGDATDPHLDIQADVWAAYLYGDVLQALRPRLEKMKAGASYMHRVPGLPMTQNGSTWFYTRPHAVQQQPVQQRQAVWGGYLYNAPVCDSPNCSMCRSIRAQLGVR